MKLSIVIPVWNESSKICKDISELDTFFTGSDLFGEIIIVDDGSDDGTAELADSMKVSGNFILNILRCKMHHGKGYAVREGVLKADGDWILLMDSGSNVPLSFITSGLHVIQSKDADIALGSRHLPESNIHKQMVWYRRIISYLFRRFISFYLKSVKSFSDTQCGFKIFKKSAAYEVFKNCRSEGFLFDIEILLTALQKEYKIIEFPLNWTCDRDSRLHILPTFVSVLMELKRIKNSFIA